MNISYDIITNRHGGRISVASEPGEGTEFLIQLPKRRWMMAQEALSA
jgi:signal transduction histidine kinase